MTYNAGIDWDNVMDLGLVPDAQIAERYGVHTTSVRSARVLRGIPPADPATRRKSGWVDWDEVHDLGIALDTEIADRLGVRVWDVTHARNRRGIPNPRGKRTADHVEARRLRAQGWTHREIADVLGVTPTTSVRWCRVDNTPSQE